MVLSVSFVLSPVIGPCCHRRLVRCVSIVTKLDASVEASRPHDFAVRASCVRLAHDRGHRILLPTSVTIAKRPSFRKRDDANHAGDLGLPSIQAAAAHWHDGQNTTAWKRSKSRIFCPLADGSRRGHKKRAWKRFKRCDYHLYQERLLAIPRLSLMNEFKY